MIYSCIVSFLNTYTEIMSNITCRKKLIDVNQEGVQFCEILNMFRGHAAGRLFFLNSSPTMKDFFSYIIECLQPADLKELVHETTEFEAEDQYDRCTVVVNHNLMNATNYLQALLATVESFGFQFISEDLYVRYSLEEALKSFDHTGKIILIPPTTDLSRPQISLPIDFGAIYLPKSIKPVKVGDKTLRVDMCGIWTTAAKEEFLDNFLNLTISQYL